MRALILAAGMALLCACGEKEPEIACCAIEPKAKCESALAGLGVSREQLAILMTAEKVCPSVEFTAERLRELDAQWPIDCREAGAMSPLRAMSSGQCEAEARNDMAMGYYTPPPGVDMEAAATCAAGLARRGLKDTEVWLVMHEPSGICPNAGVDEPRIREIIANDWEAAGCRQFTKQQMLHALDTGACGGDAG